MYSKPWDIRDITIGELVVLLFKLLVARAIVGFVVGLLPAVGLFLLPVLFAAIGVGLSLPGR